MVHFSRSPFLHFFPKGINPNAPHSFPGSGGAAAVSSLSFSTVRYCCSCSTRALLAARSLLLWCSARCCCSWFGAPAPPFAVVALAPPFAAAVAPLVASNSANLLLPTTSLYSNVKLVDSGSMVTRLGT
ncbi:hypothetical protein RIF29_17864 [Crotalaria pallida]|uniref:Uncharacterized protein n=1 Tax=Crotalaria pallida TaxID=3830 RepID=A0AAN9FI27_CROPI